MNFGPRRTNQDVFAEHLALAGARILDVGCGTGRMARLLTRMGGKVTGLEPGEVQLERARMVEPEGVETYHEGVAQKIPFADTCFDIIFFFNSLHHVPPPMMAQGLAEASRVLAPGGVLFIAEPVAAGSFHEMIKPYHDETEVRALAIEALERLAKSFINFRRIAYVSDTKFESFISFRAGQIAMDRARGDLDKAEVADLRKRFESFGEARADGIHFDQPTQAFIMEKG